MPITLPDREELKKRGLWKKCCNRRDELKRGGMDPASANDQAVMEFLGDNAYYNISKPEGEVTVESGDPNVFEEMGKMVADIPQRSRPTDLIQWVAANLSGEVDLGSCPGRDAFSLLADCIRFPSFRLDFWKSMYTKVIPSRAQLGDGDEGIEMDGAMALAVLEKIASISSLAKGEAECGES